MEDKIEHRLHELRELSKKYAKAQAQRVYLEEFKKSKLALLMKTAEQSGHTTAASQEREARAHHSYIELLEGLRDATEAAEGARWELEIAKIGCDLYRTKQANMRAEMKGYGA